MFSKCRHGWKKDRFPEYRISLLSNVYNQNFHHPIKLFCTNHTCIHMHKHLYTNYPLQLNTYAYTPIPTAHHILHTVHTLPHTNVPNTIYTYTPSVHTVRACLDSTYIPRSPSQTYVLANALHIHICSYTLHIPT